ncbi:hypothetical protein [Polaromonas sp. JS666]|uniref:hypothetical protein n=1 Tax=Polaromonas sp. (strain JS666 / ATCC BAA-500) TaxID=296591 RepID=UPI000880609E|nr:hypothetical protein [Polaromonas sp. JS666]SDN51202.1 hypothetical protein SAMN05720382_105295 [Polaromonas sp. JS666]
MPITIAASASAAAATNAAQSGATDSAPSIASGVWTADWATLIKPFTADALANGFTTLVAAFVGAMLAYYFQRRHQETQELRNELVAAHRLLFALAHQMNMLVLIQRDYVSPYLHHPGRAFVMQASGPINSLRNILELPDLAFLLKGMEGHLVLQETYMAQQNYGQALDQWNARSALYAEKVRPALIASGISDGVTVSEADMRRALGEHLFRSIVSETDSSVDYLRRAFERLSGAMKNARVHFVKRFERNDFMVYDFSNTYGLVESPSIATSGPEKGAAK